MVLFDANLIILFSLSFLFFIFLLYSGLYSNGIILSTIKILIIELVNEVHSLQIEQVEFHSNGIYMG